MNECQKMIISINTIQNQFIINFCPLPFHTDIYQCIKISEESIKENCKQNVCCIKLKKSAVRKLSFSSNPDKLNTLII